MAFNGHVNFVVVLVFVALTSAAVAPSKTKVTAQETAEDPRLFVFPLTGGTTTSDTSITLSNDFIVLVGLLFVVLLAALIIPAVIGGSLFGGAAGAELSSYGASGYHASAPAYSAHDESSYASIHRTLEDAAGKYD